MALHYERIDDATGVRTINRVIEGGGANGDLSFFDKALGVVSDLYSSGPTVFGPIRFSEQEYINPNGVSPLPHTDVLTGGDLSIYWDRFTMDADKINNESYAYHPLYQNSNTGINTILRDAGLRSIGGMASDGEFYEVPAASDTLENPQFPSGVNPGFERQNGSVLGAYLKDHIESQNLVTHEAVPDNDFNDPVLPRDTQVASLNPFTGYASDAPEGRSITLEYDSSSQSSAPTSASPFDDSYAYFSGSSAYSPAQLAGIGVSLTADPGSGGYASSGIVVSTPGQTSNAVFDASAFAQPDYAPSFDYSGNGYSDSSYDFSDYDYSSYDYSSSDWNDYSFDGDMGFGDFGFPVVLDLDGTGLKVTPQSSSNTFFDMAGDGYQHRTAWAGAGNGVLVLDLDGSGEITQRNQVIFTDWDPAATSDMQALANVFDTNHDGRLDAADDQFASFKILVTNPDGTTTLKTLAELGIESIDLTPNSVVTTLPDGSQVQGTTTLKRRSRRQRGAAPASLRGVGPRLARHLLAQSVVTVVPTSAMNLVQV
jgi:hypothetical protein